MVFEYGIISPTSRQDGIQKASIESFCFHTMDIVEDALSKVAEKSKSYKTTDVEKLVALDFDLGSLLAIDTNDLNVKKLR